MIRAFQLRKSNPQITAAVLLLVVFSIFSSTIRSFSYDRKIEKQVLRNEIKRLVETHTNSEDVFVSDVPAYLAWDSQRLSFFPPQRVELLSKLHQQREIDYVLITLGEWTDNDPDYRELFYQPKDYPSLKLIDVAQDEKLRQRYAVLYAFTPEK